MTRHIFISYRREDNQGTAGRIYDTLKAAFGKRNVFMDVTNMMVGERFDIKLQEALKLCDVVVAIIGKDWGEHVAQRVSRGEVDYVQEEIKAALNRGVTLIPVLLDDAQMPAPGNLPEELREITLIQGQRIRNDNYERDSQDLVDAIKSARKRKLLDQPAEGSKSIRQIAAAIASIGIVAAFTYYTFAPQQKIGPTEKSWTENIVGSFEGSAAISVQQVDTVVKIETEFKGPDLKGSYRYYWKKDNKWFRGTISNCKSVAMFKIECLWQRGKSIGQFSAHFTSDYSSFNGYWSEKKSQKKYSWTGRRTQAQTR